MYMCTYINASTVLQIRFNGIMMGGLFFGLTVTAFAGKDLCVNYSTTLLGNAPISLIFVAMQVRRAPARSRQGHHPHVLWWHPELLGYHF